MAIDSDFVAQYLNQIILQYSDKTNAVAEMTARLESISNTYDLLNSFSTEFDLDNAYGDRLDIIGRIVGINRILENIVAKPYFSWDDGAQPNPKTFSEGPLLDYPTDSIYTTGQLNDYQMRLFIRAKIAKNVTSAYLTSDDRVTLQDTILYIFKSLAYVIDNYDMSLTLYLDSTYDINNLILLKAQDLLPSPQGVGYTITAVVYTAGETFGFAENPNAKTFGAGKFAELVTI